MKYKIGDNVEIINYGHIIWEWKDDALTPQATDLAPELVGKKAVVFEASEPQPRFERYALDIEGIGRRAWFGVKQLKADGQV